MEPMALATLVYAGMMVMTVQPITLQRCEELKAQHIAMLCVEIEPDCGKGTTNKCLGRADLDEPVKAKPRKKRVTAARRTTRRYASR